jgi:hypothetical protein
MKLYTSFTRIFFSFSLCICTSNLLGQTIYGEKRVAFPQEKKVIISIGDISTYQRFSPTVTDIDIADSLLQNYFLTILTKQNKHPSLENYYRQYVGVVKNGIKCIYINASYKKKKYFLENTFYPKGGGQGYFRTLIDINNKSVINFHFNASK